MLIYLGKSHSSSAVHSKVIAELEAGSITLLCDQNSHKKREMIRAIIAANPLFQYIPTYLARRGLRTWHS